MNFDQFARGAITTVVAILVPVALFLSSIRLVLNPLFLQLEYNAPGFPADTFGFTKEDRLHWSRFALDYLLNDADISYLGNLEFEDGTPLYNERELSHMVDVKKLVQLMIPVWTAVVGILVGLGLASWGARWSVEYRRGLAYGGWATAALIVLLIVGVFLSFSALFTSFHRIFFEGDTWLFFFSDTLIRLFPMRLWQDAFIAVGGISLLGGLGLGFLFRKV
jgi:integral membrane protein (TIGR01906 family)